MGRARELPLLRQQLYEAILTSGKATTSINMLIARRARVQRRGQVWNIPNALARRLSGYDLTAGTSKRIQLIFKGLRSRTVGGQALSFDQCLHTLAISGS